MGFAGRACLLLLFSLVAGATADDQIFATSDFMGGSHDSMVTLENRVRGLERVVEEMAREISLSSGRRGGGSMLGFDSSPGRSSMKYNGFHEYSNSKFGRGGDGRIGLAERKLSNSSLKGFIAPELRQLSFLQELYLDHNLLFGTIPKQLGSLWNLRVLDLGVNRLTGPIPHELGGLNSISVISTAHNGLCPSPRLYVGDFSYNFLVRKIPPCLKYLPRSSFQGNCFQDEYSIRQRAFQICIRSLMAAGRGINQLLRRTLHNQSSSNETMIKKVLVLRKKAVLHLLRLYGKNSEVTNIDGWSDRMAQLLDECDLGVLTSIMSLFVALVSNNAEGHWNCRPKCVRILERMSRSQDIPQEYTYYGIPSPWL